MKKKLLLACMAFTSIIATHAFAADISKGKVIQHKEWSTGQVKAVFHEVKKPLLKSNEGRATVTTSDIDVAYGTVGIPVTVSATTRIYIRNMTGTTQTFRYNAAVCANTTAQDLECAHYFDVIELEPDGSYRQDIEPKMIVSFNQAGKYDIRAFTSLDGHNRVTSNSNSKAIIVLGKKS